MEYVIKKWKLNYFSAVWAGPGQGTPGKRDDSRQKEKEGVNNWTEGLSWAQKLGAKSPSNLPGNLCCTTAETSVIRCSYAHTRHQEIHLVDPVLNRNASKLFWKCHLNYYFWKLASFIYKIEAHRHFVSSQWWVNWHEACLEDDDKAQQTLFIG